MLYGIGLHMPFGGDDGESSEMGLKMPSKVDVDFTHGPFRGSCSCYLGRSPLGKWVSVVLLFEENSGGIESRNFSCPRLC